MYIPRYTIKLLSNHGLHVKYIVMNNLKKLKVKQQLVESSDKKMSFQITFERRHYCNKMI